MQPYMGARVRFFQFYRLVIEHILEQKYPERLFQDCNNVLFYTRRIE